MSQAKPGDTVQVHYQGSLEDGTVFDSSKGKDPLQFTLGEQNVIPGFENAVLGMAVGETRTTSIPPEEAYGEYREELRIVVEKDKFPEHITPEPGMKLQLQSEEGGAAVVTVTEVEPERIILDGNHELAGKVLQFEISLVGIA